MGFTRVLKFIRMLSSSSSLNPGWRYVCICTKYPISVKRKKNKKKCKSYSCIIHLSLIDLLLLIKASNHAKEKLPLLYLPVKGTEWLHEILLPFSCFMTCYSHTHLYVCMHLGISILKSFMLLTIKFT